MSSLSHRSKLFRARQHVESARKIISDFHAKAPYHVHTADDLGAQQRIWKLQIECAVPDELSMVVGDAIHNARAALDHLMVAVVRHCAPTLPSYKHVYFVIAESEKKFTESWRAKTLGILPAAAEAIRDLRPYRGGDESFWLLHQLDILDKHNSIIPVGSAYKSFGMGRMIQRVIANHPGRPAHWGQPPSLDIFLRPADSQFPLQNNAELLRAPLGEGAATADEFEFKFDVVFGVDQVIDGQPVVSALTGFCDFVDGVASTIENEILARPPK